MKYIFLNYLALSRLMPVPCKGSIQRLLCITFMMSQSHLWRYCCIMTSRSPWLLRRCFKRGFGDHWKQPIYEFNWIVIKSPALAITPSHHQNMHVFAHGRKNMNDIFNNYVCSASHMGPELHFQNVWREPWSPRYTGGDFMFLYRFVRHRRRPQILVHAITFEQHFGFFSFLAQLLALTCRLPD